MDYFLFVGGDSGWRVLCRTTSLEEAKQCVATGRIPGNYLTARRVYTYGWLAVPAGELNNSLRAVVSERQKNLADAFEFGPNWVKGANDVPDVVLPGESIPKSQRSR